MIIGKLIKTAYNEDKTYILNLIEFDGKWRIDRHVNFETQTVYRGTQQQVEDMFNKAVRKYNLEVR